MYQIEQNDKNTDTNTNKYEYKKSTWKTRMGEQMRKDMSQMKKFTAATWWKAIAMVLVNIVMMMNIVMMVICNIKHGDGDEYSDDDDEYSERNGVMRKNE